MYYTKILKIITGGARNLLPLAYERPAPDIRTERSKTGNFCKNGIFGNFTQPTIEHTRRFSGFSLCPIQKFPTKITGNFLEHIRELQFFILIIVTTWAMIILYLQKL